MENPNSCYTDVGVRATTVSVTSRTSASNGRLNGPHQCEAATPTWPRSATLQVALTRDPRVNYWLFAI